MGRALVGVSCLLFAGACAAPPASPPPPPVTAAPLSSAPTASASATALPEPAPSALPAPPKPEPALARAAVCEDGKATLAAVLSRYPRDVEDRAKGSVEVEDLSAVTPQSGAKLGDASVGAGYFGSLDIDGDGKLDRVLVYEGVDFWSYLFFVASGPCFRFAGEVEAYQVELVSLPGNKRAVRALLYPVGPARKIETRQWNGRAFVR